MTENLPNNMRLVKTGSTYEVLLANGSVALKWNSSGRFCGDINGVWFHMDHEGCAWKFGAVCPVCTSRKD
jgi:hypothetical protein